MTPEGEQRPQSTRESRLKPLESTKFDVLDAEELAKQAQETGYKTTPQGDAGRKYLNNISQGPRREAVKKLANVLPEFFTEHPKIEREPFASKEPKDETVEQKRQRIEKENRQRLGGIRVNKDFRDMVESFRRGYELEFKDQDIIAAWDIANEYLGNQPEPEQGEAA
ncbi:hypothetical protein KJ969_01660 [Patescibacteria group bacterium]|nr:hypothetical protein [Patescibacteria group bacterium]MBU1922116.1 hypothetical protein [Patescibacteria group bacterium]